MHLMPEDRRLFRSLDRSGERLMQWFDVNQKQPKSPIVVFRTKEMADGIAQNSTLSFSGQRKQHKSESDTTAGNQDC